MDSTRSDPPAESPPVPESFLERHQRRDLLRFLTCGSVDDGKSTLIGRLLHDSGVVFEDQLEAARAASAKHGTTEEEIDYALLLDGLEAEREQGITIDVAYRYFSTPRRSFIIADTPGHEQYTRNMATGASHCDLAVILVDARKGLLAQTRRHAFIASLFGIKHLVLAVNKMDLVDYSEEVFDEIRSAFSEFSAKLVVNDIHFIPVSALEGDNVVERSSRTPWYEGSTLLDYLETVYIASDRNLIDLRFPVQHVLRPSEEFRGYCGTVASGTLRQGSEVVVLPAGKRSRIESIRTWDGELDEASAPMAVVVTLEDEIDVARGDMMVPPSNVPELDHSVEAMAVWMDEKELEPGRDLILKQTTVEAPAKVTDLRYRINVETLHREDAERLTLNEIGRIRLESPRLIAHDPYLTNRATGAFILVDRMTNHTVAAGTILERHSAEEVTSHPTAPDAATNVQPHPSSIVPEARAERLGQSPLTVWLTGLPRSGKSSIAYGLEKRLFEEGASVQVLDGENLRLGVSSDLGFSPRDRQENIRRAAELARMLNDQGLVVLAALITPTAEDREMAREIVGEDRYLEVHCAAPLEACEARDVEGLYERARKGEIRNVTGIDAPYEVPEDPELVLPTHEEELEASVEAVRELLASRGLSSPS
ncbi:MAG: sulfate adenylyltransferase subunit CysN [Thermoanaerobaculia bacterium]|nr:sulfate adenylyltransferase subunit CysN [Thermoanaerobaculia bacterium]